MTDGRGSLFSNFKIKGISWLKEDQEQQPLRDSIWPPSGCPPLSTTLSKDSKTILWLEDDQCNPP